MQEQAESQQALQKLLQPTTSPVVSLATILPLTLRRMASTNDLKAFLGLFEHAAPAWEWPKDEWTLRLLPLQSEEAQLATQQLLSWMLAKYSNIKWAVLQQVSGTPEKHHHCFHLLQPPEVGWPFTYFQQLKDS